VIDVMAAESGSKGTLIMTTFTINEQNEIVAFASADEVAAHMTTPFDSFSSEQELAELAGSWSKERLVAIWNSLAGVSPVKSFKNSKTAATRIWPRIQSLSECVQDKQTKTESKAHRAKPSASHARNKVAKKTRTLQKAPAGKKRARAQSASTPREGSKTGQVIIMLQRKGGATLVEIMEKMGWQKHTVRGFMAGAMKKAGYAVESFRPEGGERSYRINR
jgi:hypothetical protein